MTKQQQQLKIFLDANFGKVMYKISKNEEFGLRNSGELCEAYLIFTGEDRSVLYFLPNQARGECGMIAICQKQKHTNKGVYYIAAQENWINQPNISALLKLKFL